MTSILLAILIAFAICAYFYARVVVKERTAHLEAERDAEARHAADWKEWAIRLTQTGLLFRELPITKEDLEMATRPPRETETDEEKSLEELQAEMDDLSQTMDFSSQGELGERRRLARAIALKRRDSDLKTKSELATESSENVFGSEEDLNHLRSN
jgi:hypothetical protein